MGGRPSERLMRRLGMPVSDTTILRNLNNLNGHTKFRSVNGTVHVAVIDDWAWRKGSNYGTIIVDLERRQVADLLADRSAETTAGWLTDHPEVEVVSSDRAGLYAEASRQGAPQARQVADRFHGGPRVKFRQFGDTKWRQALCHEQAVDSGRRSRRVERSPCSVVQER
jgi:transposase